jgi:hypothetical protein
MSCYCFNNEEIQMKTRRETIAKMDNNTIQLDIETFDDETFEEFLKAYEIETKYGVTKLDLSSRSNSSSLLKDISPSIKKIKEENPLENTLENKLKDTLKDVLENTLKDTLKDMFKNTVEDTLKNMLEGSSQPQVSERLMQVEKEKEKQELVLDEEDEYELEELEEIKEEIKEIENQTALLNNNVNGVFESPTTIIYRHEQAELTKLMKSLSANVYINA